tara:strand:+ start:1780 stop:5643 length:3864 start_codon:yes stop_codon:yes gene_type:complete
MKLFVNEEENFSKYVEQAITGINFELELIFGSSINKNPIDKKTFLSLLEYLKTNNELISNETTTLDIRTEYNKTNVSNIRLTINGLDSIKKYCNEDSLENIKPENMEFIQKQYYRDRKDPSKKYTSIKDYDYNVRLNLKSERKLLNSHHSVINFLNHFETKKKHFRYKKRLSFLTTDKLFRIDLSVIKSTRYSKGTYDFQKTFRKANILKNYENYELEIEYIGWKKEIGNDEIDRLYNYFNQRHFPSQGKDTIGNIYDPLNLGINTYDTGDEIDETEKDEVESPSQFEKRELRESVQDEVYSKLIGTYASIKNKYFKEFEIDLKLRDALKEYEEKGVNISFIEDIYKPVHFLDEMYALIKFTPTIGNYTYLEVPINYLYRQYTFTPYTILDKEDDTMDEMLPSKIPDDRLKGEVVNELIKKIMNILETNVIEITKKIYNTENIISFQLKEKVLDEYKKITNQKNSRYFKLMAPQPVTLTLDHLKKNNPRSILSDYAVTEKADGERYQMMIFNHRAYLLNSKKNVIDMNITLKNCKNGWLFDGEYITKDKENQPIQLYMIFDIYLDEKSYTKQYVTPQPIHTYPFISRDPFDISRYSVLQEFYSTINIEKTDLSKESIDIHIKQYEFGYLTNSEDEKQISIPEKYEFSEDIMGIFKASKKILQKEKEDYFPYRIDGLIYLPVRYSVRGNIEGQHSKSISGTWDHNFKWKPPEENTIDFLVKIKKTLVNGNVIDEIFHTIDIENGQRIMNEYKQLELFVGYDEIKDENINFCMKVLEDDITQSKEEVVRFNHGSPDEEKYDKTNIIINNGKLKCMNHEEEEIHDGDIVEMRFNKDGINGMFWEPLRVRSDKIDPQFFTIAKNVWETIQNPISKNAIQGNREIKTIVEEDIKNSGKYYVNEDDQQFYLTNSLSRLHNYIKSKLILGVYKTFRHPMKVLDLSIGRGGDISKYITKEIKPSLLVGIDISSNIDEACKRFYKIKDRKKIKGAFFRADTSKNIQTKECVSIDGITEQERIHSETLISILYGYGTPIPKQYEQIGKKYRGIAKGGFDIISSQFSLHYYFKNDITLYGFIQNLKENVKKGGYFIGTCYDGTKIFNHFKETNHKLHTLWESQHVELDEDTDTDTDTDTDIELEEKNDIYEEYTRFQLKDTFQNTVFSIEKKYTMDDFTYKPDEKEKMLGNKINVYMDSIGQPIDEYLVNFDFFIDVMHENGFEIVQPKTNVNLFHSKYFENNLGQFKNVIENLSEIRDSDEIFRKFYSEAYNMDIQYHKSPLSILSSFNSYFIFQKV